VISRQRPPPQRASFFLFGPRGTGKSTWVESAFPDALRVDLLKESTFVELAGHADRLEAMIDAHGGRTVFIDEVQKLPALLDEVHRLMQRRGHRFILTGSSARKLKRSGANLLAGRARTLTMHPFTPNELGKRFDLRFAARHGMLPSVWVQPDPEAYLKSYVGTYLRQEIQQEALVRNVAAFNRFLEAASFSQASVLNMLKVAADCGISRKTVESHFDLLEDLLLAVRLPVFTKRSRRRLTAHPKFFLFDAGVYRAIRPRGPLDAPEEIDGPAVETLVLEVLRAESANRDLDYEFFFWRTADDREVDLVLYGPRGLHAFEVKRSSVFREGDLGALRLFRQDYPKARGYLLYGGTQRYRFGSIEVMPLAHFLPRAGEVLA
jgi:predicted AAA+ superfamily ATPase